MSDTPASLTLHIPNAVIPPGFAHNVEIHDDNANWLAWGNLIKHYIQTPTARPQCVGDLNNAMVAAGVKGHAAGPNDRFINWVDYHGTDLPLTIPLPQDSMVSKDAKILAAIASLPKGQRHYPLPLFYTTIFGGAAKPDLSKNELLDMGTRRLGEYVINECC